MGHVLCIVVTVLIGVALTTLGLAVSTINKTRKDVWKVAGVALASFSPALYFFVKFAVKVLPELYQCRGGRY